MKLFFSVTLLAALISQSNANGKFKKVLESDACEADIAKFCSGLDHRERKKCIKSHFDELSLECTDAAEKQGHGHDQKHHPKPSLEVREACHDDKESLCPGLEKWDLMKCMHDKHDQISEKCTTAWKTWMESLSHQHVPDDVQKACHDNKEKFCSGVEGRWEIRMCMKKHWDDLSEECTTAVNDWMKDRHHIPHAVREACHDDKENFCPDIKCPKKVVKCMKKHWSDLSDKCTAAIKKWKHHQGEPEDNVEDDMSISEPPMYQPYRGHFGHHRHGRHNVVGGIFVHILGMICGLAFVAVVMKTIIRRVRTANPFTATAIASITVVPVVIDGFTPLIDDEEDNVITGIPLGV